MLISRGEQLFGADAVLLYQAAQWLKMRRGGFSLDEEVAIDALEFAQAIGMPTSECMPVLGEMVSAGWLALNNVGQYVLQRQFQQLAAARIGKPLKRAKADLLLAEVVERARAINREAESECDFVLEIAVFGSYLDTTKHALGDIDIGVRTQRRPRPKDQPIKRYDWREKSGDYLVKARLKGRSPYISLHDMSELTEAGFSYKTVYLNSDDLPAWTGQ